MPRRIEKPIVEDPPKVVVFRRDGHFHWTIKSKAFDTMTEAIKAAKEYAANSCDLEFKKD